MWIRVLPFAIFMGFIGIKDGVLFLVERGWLTDVSDLLDYLYPVKIVLVAAVLFFLWPRFQEMHFSDPVSVARFSAQCRHGSCYFCFVDPYGLAICNLWDSARVFTGCVWKWSIAADDDCDAFLGGLSSLSQCWRSCSGVLF